MAGPGTLVADDHRTNWEGVFASTFPRYPTAADRAAAVAALRSDKDRRFLDISGSRKKIKDLAAFCRSTFYTVEPVSSTLPAPSFPTPLLLGIPPVTYQPLTRLFLQSAVSTVLNTEKLLDLR